MYQFWSQLPSEALHDKHPPQFLIDERSLRQAQKSAHYLADILQIHPECFAISGWNSLTFSRVSKLTQYAGLAQ